MTLKESGEVNPKAKELKILRVEGYVVHQCQENIFSCIRATEDPEVICVDDESPRKRRRFHDLPDRELKRPEASTQTDLPFVRVVKPRRQQWFDFTKENVAPPLEVSPVKMYTKPPNHCRSPMKKGSSGGSQVPRTSRGRNLVAASRRSMFCNEGDIVESIDLDDEDDECQIVSDNLAPTSSQVLGPGPQFNVQDKKSYGKLLGSLLNNYKINNPNAEPKIVGTVDLTDSNDDDCVIVSSTPAVCKIRPFKNSKSELSGTTFNFSEMPGPSNPKPLVRKSSNTLEEKIKPTPFASDDWISEIVMKYDKLRLQRTKEKEELEKNKASTLLNTRTYISLEKELLRHKALTEVVLPIEEEVKLPELTKEMLNMVNNAWRPRPDGEVLVDKFNYLIRRRDINTLAGLNWLNDEVINFYMELMIERFKQNPNKYPSVYAFNSFLYQRLQQGGYKAVRRWTKKVDIFSHDILLIPIHLKMHWCMVTIHVKEKRIRYYDSMGHPNDTCLNALLNYLIEEMQDKKNETLDKDNWVLENKLDIPQQENGSDCGVFACTFAEFVSRKSPFKFSQKEMPYFRKKMTYEILTAKLIT